jgi:predicted component of type VI protein secretion system
MPAQLLSLSEAPDILLDKPILLFGRHLECDIQLNSRKISRRHCCIAQVGDRLIIRDLGSTNGIRINGERVLEGYLKAGDELTIGNFRFTVQEDALGNVPAAVEPPKPAKAPPPRRAPALPVPDDDALLEECDEPVPLAEPSGAPAARNKPPNAPPRAVTPPKSGPSVGRSSPNGGSGLMPVIPDDLELAPPSDVPKINLEKRPPSSHEMLPSPN